MEDLLISETVVAPATGLALYDVYTVLLADKRSENTRRAYAHDLRLFFLFCYSAEPDHDLVQRFLQQPTVAMTAQILAFKAQCFHENLAESTINRRIAAILSLVRYGRRLGVTEADPSQQIDTEKVQVYRDTRGITAAQARVLLRVPDRSSCKGARDFALLLLMLENGLRRAEIVGLMHNDFMPGERRLSILGKGRGTQRETVTLSPTAVEAILAYRSLLRDIQPIPLPLFCSVSPAAYGRALTADGLYKIVRSLASEAGLDVCLSPHRLRHTAITLALDASGGDIRRVQRLSRHARLETLQIYDDNRADLQGEMTDLLSEMLNAP